jgi:hypothetical protein
MRYESASSKAVATARMYVLAGVPTEPLGPGSKEKRSALEALARFLGLDVTHVPRKAELGRVIAQHLSVEWDGSCYSRGDTITLTGLNRLVDATVTQRLIPPVGHHAIDLLGRVIVAAQPGQHSDAVQASLNEEQNVPEDLSELEQNIAEYIAQLSEPVQPPEGVDPAPEQFDPEAVRLEDGSWRQRLIDVQGWLFLPTELEADSPETFDESLAIALGLDVEPSTDPYTFFARLTERLDKATALRDEFIARLDEASEGTETLETASRAWAGAWEDAEQEEEEDPEAESTPIHADAVTWPITEFVQHANDNELNLSPSYQRADVWPIRDAQLLIESILRGIPLPSVIILESDESGLVSYEVVDGKQRLTSILRFIGAHPEATKLVRQKAADWGEPDLERLFQEDYPTFKKLWNKNEPKKLTAQLERTLYFPFALRRPNTGPLGGSLSQLKGKYYSEIRQETIQVQSQPKKVLSVFEQQSAYKIPVITYKQVTPAQVHEVFSLYNKQGKHLNAEEIRNALYHELTLMKALLVTAGDSENIADVAPFLVDSWQDLSSTSETLDGYGFGRVGYKRTKILSWATATLLLDDGSVEGRSTASHINALLKRVATTRNDPLRDVDRVKAAMVMLDRGIDAHALADAGWAPSFKNAQGKNKWQELQLVASIIGMAAATFVLGDDLEDAADGAVEDLSEASARWERPKSAQSRDQWRFISMVVADLLEVLGVDPTEADAAIRDRFGASGLADLLRA